MHSSILKAVLIGLFCLPSFLATAQPLEIRLLLLTDQEAQIDYRNSSEELERLKAIVFPDKSMCGCTDVVNNNYYNRFQFLDLDRDGKEDIVYSGACNPYPRVRVWMNTEKGYKEAFDEAGSLMWVNPLGTGMEIALRKESVACDYTNKATILSFDQRMPGEFETKSLSWHRDLDWKRYQLRSAERITSKDDVLRLSKEVNNKPQKDKCSGDMVAGNLYLRLSGKTEGARLDFTDDGWNVYMIHTGDSNFHLGWRKN